MKRFKLMILASNTTVHTSTIQILENDGHSIQLVDSCVQLLAESIRFEPDLVLIPYLDFDTSLNQVIDQIESKGISNIALLTSELTLPVTAQLQRTRLGVFIPLDTPPLLMTSLITRYARLSDEHTALHRRIETLEGRLSDRDTIGKAKRHLMKKWDLPEEAAYQMIRKKSMDKSKSMAVISREILSAN